MEKELRILGWILQNYHRNPSVAKMAEMFGMSPSVFQQKFRLLYGLSPKRYVLALRMQEVERLLIETNIPIKEIVFALSFNSHSALCAQFRKKHGITASQFRRRSWGGLRE